MTAASSAFANSASCLISESTRKRAARSSLLDRQKSASPICTPPSPIPPPLSSPRPRGGYGSNYLLEGVDLALIRQHPKPFFAYSDMTGLQLHLLDQLGLPAFHGPMVAADFYLEDGVHLASFQSALAGTPYTLGATEGLRTLKPGSASGTLYGGCLSILVSLLGTPWEPSTEGKLLFVEDRGSEALPDRPHAVAVAQGWQAGSESAASSSAKCSTVTSPGAPANLLEDTILTALAGLDIPIAIGLRSGHVSRQNVTLIFGVEAELHAAREAQLNLLATGGAVMTLRTAATFTSAASAARPWPRLLGCFNCRAIASPAPTTAAYPPMSDLLRELGIPVLEPYSRNPTSIPRPTSSSSAMRSRAEILRSSTSSTSACPSHPWPRSFAKNFSKAANLSSSPAPMEKPQPPACLSWIYQVAARENPALEPSFLIGGVAENFGTSFQLRPTRTFIIEGDEYDTAFFDKGPKFLHYFPDALILTHVEFDHADIYADLEAVKTAFKRLVNLVPRRGLLVAYRRQRQRHRVHQPRILPGRALRVHAGMPTGRCATFATSTAVRSGNSGTTATLWSDLEMHLAGEHNALNATAAAALAAGQGISKESIRSALATSKASSAASKFAT